MTLISSLLLSGILLIVLIWLISLKRSIRALTRDLKNANDQGKSFCQLRIESPDQSLEELAVEINRSIRQAFLAQEEQNRKEELLRKEITNISHDLRTPLTSILGYLELTKEEDLSNDQKEYLNIVTKRAKNLTSLVSQLYEYTRLESGEFPIHLQTINLTDFFREHLLEFYGDFEAKGLEVALALPERPLWISADPAALARVFQNMTSNCIKYSQKSVSISLEEHQKGLLIQYRNRAPGLSKTEVTHLFERFYQADSARSGMGSGLGLTVAKLLIEKMNGTVISSFDGEWLSVQITFPSTKKPASPA